MASKTTANRAPLTQIVVDALEEMKAKDIVCIDVEGKTSVTDMLVIASGTSNRHVKSLIDNVAEKAKHNGYRPLGTEGGGGSEWVLLDLGDIVVHVMMPNAREFYDLERLWGNPSVDPQASDSQVAQ